MITQILLKSSIRKKFVQQQTNPLPINRLNMIDINLATSVIDAWSVKGSSLNSSDITSTLFAVSLFPYLGMLYFLSKSETKTPKMALNGFTFLLVFVLATIPAGIYAKYQYHDILANVDWLHGSAESLLTITNLLIISGFRDSRPKPDENKMISSNVDITKSNDLATPVLLFIGLLLSIFSLSAHNEPSNALSLPTWIVHSSSILEWLTAMALIWDHAITSGNPRWRGLTIAMMLSNASGLCACTFHFFFNNPELTWLVVLQSALTVIGNTCLAFAAYRIYKYELDLSNSNIAKENMVYPILQPLKDSNIQFFLQLFVKSFLAAVFVKYGELYLDFPFDASNEAALFVLLNLILMNVIWSYRLAQTKFSENIANIM